MSLLLWLLGIKVRILCIKTILMKVYILKYIMLNIWWNFNFAQYI